MPGRPTSISVIAWILIALGGLGFVTSAVELIWDRNGLVCQSSLPPSIQLAVWQGGNVLYVICGYFLLWARNWARYLYVGSMAVLLSISYWTSPAATTMLPGVVTFLVISYFLFRPAANAYFSAGGANLPPPKLPSARRVASIICYVISGVFFLVIFPVAFLGTPGDSAKWLAIAFQLLHAAVFLSVGRVLSPDPRWMGEIGIVFLAVTLLGAVSVLAMFVSPAYVRSPPEGIAAYGDFLTGILWIALMTAAGGVCLFMSRKQRGWETERPRPKTSAAEND